VEPAAGEIRKIERRGSGAANAGGVSADFHELSHVFGQQVVSLEWEAGSNQCSRRIQFARNGNGSTVDERSSAASRCEGFVSGEIANDTRDQPRANHYAD